MATSDHTDERPESVGEAVPVADENKEDLSDLINEQSDNPPLETTEDKPDDKVNKAAVQAAVDAAANQANEKPEDKPRQTSEAIAQHEGEDHTAFQKRVLEEYTKESSQVNTEELDKLRREVEFYRLLNGNPNQQQQPQQQVQPQPQQQPQQVVQNAAVQALDIIDITEDELLGLVSGSRERALPVVRKFVATAAVIALQEFQRQSETAQRTNMYVENVRKDFHDRFEDLRDYPEIVRAVGNDIGNSYVRRGIARMPHELLDEVAEKSRALIKRFANGGSSNSPTAVRGSRQGNAGGGVRPAPVRQEQLTDQQKEMVDILDNQ